MKKNKVRLIVNKREMGKVMVCMYLSTVALSTMVYGLTEAPEGLFPTIKQVAPEVVAPEVVAPEVVAPEMIIERVPESRIPTKRIGKYKVKGYCNCTECAKNDVRNPVMRDYAGVTVTVNPTDMPYGTKLWIDGVGVRQAQPSSQKVAKNLVKVYFATHAEVEAFGVQEIVLYKIMEESR